MVNLIGNEIKKIFAKWAIKIIILMAVILMIIECIMVKHEDEIYQMAYYDNASTIEFYEEELKSLNPENEEEREIYISDKSQVELLKLEEEYKNEEKWKFECITQNAYDYIYNINEIKYGSKENDKELKKAEENYNDFLNMLESGDWEQYTKQKLEIAKADLEVSQKELENATTINKEEKEQIVESNELEIECLEIRLNKKIPYDGSYMDEALNIYSSGMQTVLHDNEEIPQSALNEVRADAMIAKYALDTEKDLFNYKNASRAYSQYMESVGLMLLAVIIIVVAASIISEEFNKGTIKQLLIRPYKRETIWLAKFLTTIIVTIISMLLISIIAIIIFGVFFSFEDFSIYNVGVYDYNSGSAYSMNVFEYVGIILISKLPFLIMLSAIAMFVSTLTNGTALAVAVPLLGQIAGEFVNSLLGAGKKYRFLKFFITPNWDLSIYNFGKPAQFEFLNFKFSLVIYIIYLAALIGLSIYRFKKEDIKNI